MSDPFDEQAAELFAGDLARDVVVARAGADPQTVRAVVEHGVEQLGEYGRVIGSVTRVGFRNAEFAPQRGDLVTIDDTVRAVESVDNDDGYITQVVLHG